MSVILSFWNVAVPSGAFNETTRALCTADGDVVPHDSEGDVARRVAIRGLVVKNPTPLLLPVNFDQSEGGNE